MYPPGYGTHDMKSDGNSSNDIELETVVKTPISHPHLPVLAMACHDSDSVGIYDTKTTADNSASDSDGNSNVSIDGPQ